MKYFCWQKLLRTLRDILIRIQCEYQGLLLSRYPFSIRSMKSFEFCSGFNRSRPMLTNRGFKQTATVNNSLATVVRFLGILPSLKKTIVILRTTYPNMILILVDTNIIFITYSSSVLLIIFSKCISLKCRICSTLLTGRL